MRQKNDTFRVNLNKICESFRWGMKFVLCKIDGKIVILNFLFAFGANMIIMFKGGKGNVFDNKIVRKTLSVQISKYIIQFGLELKIARHSVFSRSSFSD